MERTFTTREVARILGTKPANLISAIWNDRIKAPQKHGQNYLWTLVDIQHASWVLLHRAFDSRRLNNVK